MDDLTDDDKRKVQAALEALRDSVAARAAINRGDAMYSDHTALAIAIARHEARELAAEREQCVEHERER